MKWFSDLKIARKLAVSFGLIMVIMTGMGVFAIVQFAKLYEPTKIITSDSLPSIQSLGKAAELASSIRRSELGFLVSDSQALRDSYFQSSQTRDKDLDQTLVEYEKTVTSDDERALYKDIQAKLQAYREKRNQVFSTFKAGKTKDAIHTSLAEGKPLYESLAATINEDVKLSASNAEKEVKLSESVYSSSRILVISIVCVAVAFGIFLATIVSRTIANPLRIMQDVAAKLALGDVEQNITNDSRDEIGSLAQSFREVIKYNQGVAHSCELLGRGDLTIDVQAKSEKDLLSKSFGTAIHSMRETIMEMADSSSGIASAAEELSATSTQMNSNATETAAQSSSVAGAAEEMTASIKEISTNAHEAAKIAGAGVKIAADASEKVSKLDASSQEIGQVVKVITTIAEQTHLLALNATIEAARAGEAGAGFAVVAGEVKELARETAKATEDIRQKIEAIQADTKGAIDGISEISKIVAQISDIQNTIASAVEEQTATTNEITHNISGMAMAAKSTTEGAEYTNKAAGELARLATKLQSLVQQFECGKEERSTNKAARKPTVQGAVINGSAANYNYENHRVQ